MGKARDLSATMKRHKRRMIYPCGLALSADQSTQSIKINQTQGAAKEPRSSCRAAWVGRCQCCLAQLENPYCWLASNKVTPHPSEKQKVFGRFGREDPSRLHKRPRLEFVQLHLEHAFLHACHCEDPCDDEVAACFSSELQLKYMIRIHYPNMAF